MNEAKPIRRLLASLLAVAGLTLGIVTVAPEAQAASPADRCPRGALCFYFNSDWNGAQANFYRPVDGFLGNDRFRRGSGYRPGNGVGVPVGNNAASVINRTGHAVFLSDGTQCTGRSRQINPGATRNLAAIGLKNQVSSFMAHQVGAGAACVGDGMR
ncbi:peptidase inhibitor family I36 protein [Georgenia alba]|uniref:Peptidase inhibitor family I36 protein n=1 Tax=Georgenia alba TaxID=2233858 RepID=A0ABW2Q6X6_9MICO